MQELYLLTDEENRLEPFHGGRMKLAAAVALVPAIHLGYKAMDDKAANGTRNDLLV